jgi:thioredoxin 1
MIEDITNQNRLTEIMNSNYELIVLDIYATWCGPCSQILPKIEALSKKYSSPTICFIKINSETGLKQNVRGLPSFEFWVQDKMSNKKILFHTVLGANIKEIEETLYKFIPAHLIQNPLNQNSSNNPNNPNRQNSSAIRSQGFKGLGDNGQPIIESQTTVPNYAQMSQQVPTTKPNNSRAKGTQYKKFNEY